MPEVVVFSSNSIACRAFIAFENFGLNMMSIQVNFESIPEIELLELNDEYRVILKGKNDNQCPSGVWFDTSEQSAKEIETLILTGKGSLLIDNEIYG